LIIRWSCLTIVSSALLFGCGEPIPVDCATETECTTEREGDWDSGPTAGVAAGLALVAAALGNFEGDSGSNTNTKATIQPQTNESPIQSTPFNTQGTQTTVRTLSGLSNGS
ncbi:MAG: hypothetical protein VW701_09760, partial [Deltaproteobacteria bacterium]